MLSQSTEERLKVISYCHAYCGVRYFKKSESRTVPLKIAYIFDSCVKLFEAFAKFVITYFLCILMTLKRIISFILLLTLMIQMLPVKQVGAVLFSNQINEEIPHDTDGLKDASKKQVLSNDYLVTAHSNNIADFLVNSRRFIFYSSEIPCNHALEILVPPPNLV